MVSSNGSSAKKSNGSIRLCIDYWASNGVIVLFFFQRTLGLSAQGRRDLDTKAPAFIE